jgi:antitoxin MazE
MMRARLVKIGNSRGIRLSKPVIEQARLGEEVEVEVRDGAVVITSSERPRVDWADAAREMRERHEDRLLDEPTATRFDEKEWRWR